MLLVKCPEYRDLTKENIRKLEFKTNNDRA